MKGGIGWNLRISDVEPIHQSDVSVSRNWHKTVSKLYQNGQKLLHMNGKLKPYLPLIITSLLEELCRGSTCF